MNRIFTNKIRSPRAAWRVQFCWKTTFAFNLFLFHRQLTIFIIIIIKLLYYPLFALFLSRLACGLLWIKKRSRKTRSALAKFRVQCKLFNSALNLCRNNTWLILASAAVLYLRLKNIYFIASCEHNVWYRELKRLRVFFKYWKVCIVLFALFQIKVKTAAYHFLCKLAIKFPASRAC